MPLAVRTLPRRPATRRLHLRPMCSIPTRFDPSERSLRTLNKYLLLVTGPALVELKTAFSADSRAFRYIADVLLAEARFMQVCTEYGLYRRHSATSAAGSMLAVVCARTHQWLRVDAALEAFLGYTREELEEDWLITLHPETSVETETRLIDAYRQLHDGDAPFVREEIRYQSRIGYSIWARVTHSLVRDRFGRPDRYVLSFEDTSLRQWTEVLCDVLRGLRTVMDAAGYAGSHRDRVDALLRHADGEWVPPGLLGGLEELYAAAMS